MNNAYYNPYGYPQMPMQMPQMQMPQMPMQMPQMQMPQTPQMPQMPEDRGDAARKTITITRTVNLFRAQSDGKMRVSVGDLTAPWTGRARDISKDDCVRAKSGKAWVTRNEWTVTLSISDLGFVRVVKAVDTGVEYTRDDFDDDEDDFDKNPEPKVEGDKEDAGTL